MGRLIGLAGAALFLGGLSVSAAIGPPETDIRKGARKVRVQAEWLAAGLGAIWVSNPVGQEVYRLDPRSGRVVRTVKVPQEPCQASAVGFGALWTATCRTAGLARIDPKTNRVRFTRIAVSSAIGDAGSIGTGVESGS
jgi:streptogramin lyase